MKNQKKHTEQYFSQYATTGAYHGLLATTNQYLKCVLVLIYGCYWEETTDSLPRNEWSLRFLGCRQTIDK